MSQLPRGLIDKLTILAAIRRQVQYRQTADDLRRMPDSMFDIYKHRCSAL